jgi:hypothetical protein
VLLFRDLRHPTRELYVPAPAALAAAMMMAIASAPGAAPERLATVVVVTRACLTVGAIYFANPGAVPYMSSADQASAKVNGAPYPPYSAFRLDLRHLDILSPVFYRFKEKGLAFFW